MSKPPLPPRSPSPSVQSYHSSQASHFSDDLSDTPYSDRIRDFFDSFENAERFSQIGPERGRGIQLVREIHAVLTHVWLSRNPEQPHLCFDKHDGRESKTIYYPPERQPGGIVAPCRLDGREGNREHGAGSVSIVHHHISLRHESKNERRIMEKAPPSQGKQKKVQSTLNPLRREDSARHRNKGRFVKKSLVHVSERTPIAPSIPLAPNGIRELLQHWVVGDSSRGLNVPLSEFTYSMINGKDSAGKKHKALYSKRRTVSVSVLLALRDAAEKEVSFAEAFGINSADLEPSKLSMTKWEHLSRRYMREGRRMSKQDIIILGMQMYKKEFLDLLP